MDPFSALSVATAVIDLGTTCIQIAKLIKNAHQSAEKVFGELGAFHREVNTLHDVTQFVGRITETLDGIKSSLSSEDQLALETLTSGISSVVAACMPRLAELDNILKKYQPLKDQDKTSRRDALSTLWQVHGDKDNISNLRQGLRWAQDELQIYLAALQLLQIRGTYQSTSSSIDSVSDQVSKLSAQIEKYKSLLDVKQHAADSVFMPAKLNKYFCVPRPVESLFTGRESLLKKLRVALDPRRETVEQKRFVIHGWPGSGKTEFCYRFANLYRESFWGIFVVDATTHEHAVNSFHQIIQETTGNVDNRDLRLAKQWFARQEQSWLLIIDNADDPRLQIKEYFPPGNRGCILINSRNRILQIEGNVGERFYRFEGLGESDGQTLLLRAANELSPYKVQVENAAKQISSALHHLPLALMFAGKAIRDKISTWTSYLDWYKSTQDRYYNGARQFAADDDDDDDISLTVIPTFEPLIARLELSSNHNDRQSLELLYLLTHFHHSNINLDLLTNVVRNAYLPDFIIAGEEHPCNNQDQKFIKPSTHDPSAQPFRNYNWLFVGKSAVPDIFRETRLLIASNGNPAIRAADLSAHRLRKLLRRLEELGLIRGGEEEKTYSIHPLIHSWVRSRLSKTWQRAIWCEAANRALADSIVLDIPALYTGRKSKPYFDARQLLPHIDHARECKRAIDIDLDRKRLALKRPSWPPLVSSDSHFLTRRDQAIQLIKFSMVYARCRRYEDAHTLQLKARDYIVPEYGMNNECSIHVTLALANIQRFLGKDRHAFELQQKAVKACEIVYGPDHMHTIWMLSLLGAFAYLEERLDQAEGPLSKAFSHFKNCASTTDSDLETRQMYRMKMMSTQAMLAGVACRSFEFEKAKDMCEEALRELDSYYSDRQITPGARETLLEIYYWSEDEDQERPYQVAVALHKSEENFFGTEHPLTLWASLLICRVLWSMKRYGEGLARLDKLLPLGKAAVGEDHFAIKVGEMLKGAMLRDMGRHDEALPLLIRCEQVFEEKSLRFYRISTLMHLSRLYEAQKKYADAVWTATTVKEVIQDLFPGDSGRRHPLLSRMDERITRLQPMVSLDGGAQTDLQTSMTDSGLRKRRDASTIEADPS